MTNMGVAILVPTLARPHRIEPLLESLERSTTAPHTVIFGASDDATVEVLERLGTRYLRDAGGLVGTYPKRINALFRATSEPYVLLGADDLEFHPGWFEAAMRAMNDVDGVVGINDLYASESVHFLVSRHYIDTLGGSMDEPGVVLHEGYHHWFCDDELRGTAQCRRRWAYAADAIVEHLHPGAAKAPNDKTYELGHASSEVGLEVFRSREHLWRRA
jgi:glycosyltransferase involved in cell wall biosynthesis